MTDILADDATKPAPPSRLRRWGRLLGHFLAGQLSIQAINLATGLLLVHLLPVDQYARFGVAFAFQTTIAMLVDVGFSNSIVALVGRHGSDPKVVGGYIRSAQHYRNRMFILIAAGAAVAFPLVTYHQAWGAPVKAALFAAILSSVFLQRQMMYGAPLLIHRKIVPYYSAQFAGAAIRLALAILLFELGFLTAVTTAWLTTLMIGINGTLYHIQARPLLHEPRRSDPRFNRDMIKLIMPLIPGIVFTAFQGQIAVGLITIFGKTRSIAEVAALGRLGQLFAVFTAFNSVLIEPHVAGLAAPMLRRRYILIALGGCTLALLVTLGAFAFPGPLLWLLGHSYRNLRLDVGWVVAASCVGYVAGLLWVMNAARKFLYWWYTWAYIGIVLVSQIVCVTFMDLSSTRHVIYFMLIGNAATLLAHVAGGVYGLGRTRAHETTDQPALSPAPN